MNRPSITDYLRVCSDIPEDEILDFCTRLPDRYFEFFTFETQCEHLRHLYTLSAESPVQLLFFPGDEDRINCTVLTYNYPFLFSLITGLLSSNGVEILSGEIFTYSSSIPGHTTSKQLAIRDRRQVSDRYRRRKVVDFFSVKIISNISFRKWLSDVIEQFITVTHLLETGSETSMREASQLVNRQAATTIQKLGPRKRQFLSPVQISFDNSNPNVTRLTLVTENTPFFLYSFSTALAHHEISIDHLRITTNGNQVHDTFDLTDAHGQKLESPSLLDQLRLSVLLCKQFTYFLDQAPNPFDAISRFEQLVGSILELPEKGQWIELLSNPLALRDMAKLLGTSDYLWEDFIRLHYESLLPVLGPRTTTPVYSGDQTMQSRLDKLLKEAPDLASKKMVINQFKDHETFLIDLSHILEQTDILTLSKQLTLLVEVIIPTAIQILKTDLIQRHGVPMTIGNIPAQYAVFGLGKLGGAALGYASDIELLLIYSDNGTTDGDAPISNADFFCELVRELRQFIVSKRAGIFDIDLRLRPYGNDGPLAVSVENFCRYFGKNGSAHTYEQLALVRLRYISGHATLGHRIEKLRDEFVYKTDDFDFSELWDLRKKQYQEKAPTRLNAKFSPGALVDIEYTVQALQISYGRRSAALRTPKIREALAALRKAGVLNAEETSQIIAAYIFLRRLTNALRILRGSAEDLFLPDVTSIEYDHLARRMGYRGIDHLSAAEQLHMEFEAVTATARTFLQTHFTRQSLPSTTFVNVADLVLNPDLPKELRLKTLKDAGFNDPNRADVNLMQLAAADHSPAHFARLVVLACEWLRHKPDPDMALNNWERFVSHLTNPAEQFNLLLSQPIRLDILLDIFSVSQFLSDTLIRHPEFFSVVTQKGALHRRFLRGSRHTELELLANTSSSTHEWRNRLRLFKRRELLRIAIKDISLQIAMPEIYRDISLVAESAIHACVTVAFQKIGEDPYHLADRFCMMAMGKLGATELNYSSDVDLIPVIDLTGIPDSAIPDVTITIESILRQVNDDLSEFTDEGQCYRMDYTLRPFGGAGQWVTSTTGLIKYYAESASKWEIQALLKMRPLAGNWAIGFELIDSLKHQGLSRFPAKELVSTIRDLRITAIRKATRRRTGGIDIKNGAGGIRDIEFWIQGLQLTHVDQFTTLWIRRTLPALDALRTCGIITDTTAFELKDIYLFYRRLEHFLQLLDDQQTHTLPTGESELDALSKRLLGSHATGLELGTLIEEFREKVIRLSQS